VILDYNGVTPKIAEGVFIDESAFVIGDVELGAGVNIWFYSVVRGDVNYIKIGDRTNIQDQCTIHVTREKFPTIIGKDVTLGHRALVHGCVIKDRALIGMGAVVLDGAEVGEGAIVAAGAVVPPGKTIPAGKLAAGVPAKVIRDVTEEELNDTSQHAENYMALALDYPSRNSKIE
jgi:carbonic anhydrase/acetyltransferase-like protein (isoleucine patch superfamily)